MAALSMDDSLDSKLTFCLCKMLIKQIVCNHPVATGRLYDEIQRMYRDMCNGRVFIHGGSPSHCIDKYCITKHFIPSQ